MSGGTTVTLKEVSKIEEVGLTGTMASGLHGVGGMRIEMEYGGTTAGRGTTLHPGRALRRVRVMDGCRTLSSGTLTWLMWRLLRLFWMAGGVDPPPTLPQNHSTEEDHGNNTRSSEKLTVPEFCGEGSDSEVGKAARSYVRKIQAWVRNTKLPPTQRALALYSALKDRAWVYAEELDIDRLGSEEGMGYYLDWVQTRFMDVEVSKIS